MTQTKYLNSTFFPNNASSSIFENSKTGLKVGLKHNKRQDMGKLNKGSIIYKKTCSIHEYKEESCLFQQ